MTVYDFDGTIYNGDSSIDFYLFCLLKRPYIIVLLPITIWGFVLYKFKIKEKEYFKSKYFSFLKMFSNIDKLVDMFWDKNQCKIKNWYLEQQDKEDIIITASPEFLIKNITDRLNIKYLVASKVNPSNGEFFSRNCYGIEKVKRFYEEFNNSKIDGFYSDSMSDLPMMQIAKNAYLVSKNDIKKLDLN